MSLDDGHAGRRRFLRTFCSAVPAALVWVTTGRASARSLLAEQRTWQHVCWQACPAGIESFDQDTGKARIRLPSGALYGINATGLALWRLCDGHKSGNELVLELERRAGIDATRAHADVERFLVAMASAGLVRPT